jgi:hypothetical protein
VPTSNGVTDDGMGVVTILESIRYFIDHPPRQTIIFLLNNFEEGGLIGAKIFINHPWYRNVKLFLNLGKRKKNEGITFSDFLKQRVLVQEVELLFSEAPI